MRTLSILIIIVVLPSFAYSWGQTGHRTTGYIASKHLTKKAKKNIDRILKGESLAYVSTWMDFIRSDDQYDHTHPWHYATIPDGMTYEQAGTPEEGDAIVTINRLIQELKTGNFSDYDESFALKCLIHLIGDVHQPLHVGNGNDLGGNTVKVKWFGRDSNLHRVWDTDMINNEKWSAEELANQLEGKYSDYVERWTTTNVEVWINESYELRQQVYNIPENGMLWYPYLFENWYTVEVRLMKAGLRLAAVLNEIYG